jgi:hypothetical protein
MMMDGEERRAHLARAGKLGGFSRAAKLSPEERARRASVAGKASAERRRLEREAGIVRPKKPKKHPWDSLPPQTFAVFVEQVREADPALSEDVVYRQAAIFCQRYLVKIDIAVARELRRGR